jgi:hypothetical protein
MARDVPVVVDAFAYVTRETDFAIGAQILKSDFSFE